MSPSLLSSPSQTSNFVDYLADGSDKLGHVTFSLELNDLSLRLVLLINKKTEYAAKISNFFEKIYLGQNLVIK